MTKVSEKELINLIMLKLPKFIPYWETYINYWGTDEGIIMQMLPFGKYAVDLLKSKHEKDINLFFDFIEYLMCNGDKLVQAAITTGLLEHLLNNDPDEIQFITFRQYLGYNTLEYCRAWDRFTGVFTKGLHDDEI